MQLFAMRFVAAAMVLAAAVGCTSEDDPAEQRTATEQLTQAATPAPGETTSQQTEAAAPDATEPSKRLPANPQLKRVKVKLRRVAKLDEPTSMAVRAGDDGIYVTERAGRIKVVRDGKVKTLLDWRKHTKHGNEQGMLGLTFSPDGGRLYVYYIDKGPENSHLDEYTMDGNRLVRSSRRQVLFVKQPEQTVHKGGQLAFGPDGMLYLSLGDGGPSDVPPTTSQRLDTLLGKLVRIDPAGGGERGYAIPADNPFAARNNARGEIYALGLRNPWRFSFDRETGDLWLADVGRYIIEEINYRPWEKIAASNFGWPAFEGTSQRGTPPQGKLVEPFFTYPHDTRCAIVGGYVYRGAAIDALRGAYVYGDYCDGEARALVRRDGKAVQSTSLGVSTPTLTSFGQDNSGELYVLSLEEGLQKIVERD